MIMRKRLLMYVHYYYPDVASTAQIYTDLSKGLSKFFDITIICTAPSYLGKVDNKYRQKRFYFEEYAGIKIIRVRVPEFSKTNKISRVKNIFAYFVNSMLATYKMGRQDFVFSSSQPPILGGMLGVWGKNHTKGKLIYNIQDFNPEQTMAVNYMGTKLVHRLMMYFDKRSCKKSDLVITVGKEMLDTLKQRFKNEKLPNSTVINNWIDENFIYPLNKNHSGVINFKKRFGLNDKFIIMYSGNVGLYYDLENLVKIFAEYQNHKDVIFAIVGEGAIKSELEKYVNDNNIKNIKFIPYQELSHLIYSLNAADIHIVTNAKGIKGISVPSKIYGVMATNVPVLGILEEGTEAWDIIEESNCGVLAHANEYKEIRSAVDLIVKEKYDFVNKHLTGREYLVDRYTKNKSIDKYKNAILDLDN